MNEALSTFIEDSKKALAEKEDKLKEFQEQIISHLEGVLKENPEIKGYMLNGRVKKPDSLKEKIIRKIKFYEDSNGDSNVFIDKLLDDIIGVRILCLLNEDEEKIYNILKNYFTEHLPIEGKTHLVNANQEPSTPYLAYLYEKQPVPQKNGKGIYKLKLKFVPEEGEFINIELQIKSLTHMFWGELEHMLFYKNYKYNLDNDLYSKMMSSVNGMLESLDTQLKDLKSHMSKNDKIKDTQNMLTKTLYNSIHDDIKEIHKVELDLREVYTLLSQLFFFGCDEYQESLKISQEIFFKLQQISFSLPEFQFDTLPPIENFKNDLISFIEAERVKELARQKTDEDDDDDEDINYFDEQTYSIFEDLARNLETLSKGKDIFWCCLLAIHIKLSLESSEEATSIEKYKQSIYKISVDFINGYIKKYIDDIQLDIDEQLQTIILINNAILEGLLDCFYKHQKMDFFLEGVHQEKIISIIRKFIESHEDSFPSIYDITNLTHRNQIKETLTCILKIQIQYYLDNKIQTDHMRDLKTNVDRLNPIDWNSNIDTQNLEDIINGTTIITNLEELQKKMYFVQEEDE
ncbi:hypothetical protein ACWKS6_26390 [Bacillus cereus]